MMKQILPVDRSSTRGWLLWICMFSSWATFAQSQKYTLTGKVTDAAGQGIPGIAVLLQGTTSGTATSVEGTYSFEATANPGSYTLLFSALGYGSETRPITLGTQSTVTTNVTLTESTQALDEVVVVGSTVTTTRRELGNAISTVKAQDIVQSGSGGLLNSLQGKVPGAQIVQNSGDPAGSISVRLRGIKSLAGPSDPLYVIDGVIISNQSTNVSQLATANDIGNANPGQNRLADLNPNDIQSINVINGAAAAAQYGSRAANGVVLITTKRGQSGTPRITFSTSFNINELRKMVPVNTYGKQFGFESITLYPIRGVSPEQIAANPGTTTVGITRAGTTAQLTTNLFDVTRYNYFKQIFRTGYGTDNSLSVSGGSDRTQYYLSFGYLKNQGIIRGTDFTRYNIRARVDQRLTNWIKLSGGLNYINSFSNEKANGNVFYSPINSVNITNNIYDITRRDAAGNLLAVELGRVNPLSTIEDMKFTQGVNRTISDIQVNLSPFKGLSIDYILGVDTYSQVGRSYIRPYPYQAQAGLPAARYPGGYAANGNNAVLLLNSDLNATYERTFSENFKLNLTAGYNYQ